MKRHLGWTDAQIIEVLSAHIHDHGGIHGWCRNEGREFSVSFISDVLRGRRDMTPRLAKVLGFVPEPRTYQRLEKST